MIQGRWYAKRAPRADRVGFWHVGCHYVIYVPTAQGAWDKKQRFFEASRIRVAAALFVLRPPYSLEEAPMLRLALALLIIALLAGLFGFNLVGDFAFAAGQTLFFVFLVLAVVAFLAGSFRSAPPG